MAWNPLFRDRFAGTPLSTAAFSFDGRTIRGNAIITATGIEGGAVYALSTPLRDAIAATGPALLIIDLAPDRDATDLTRALTRPRGARLFATHLRRSCGLDGIRAALPRETTPDIANLPPIAQARAIKAATVTCLRPRPLAEAISSAGGVLLSEPDETLMLRRLSGVFCAGEMLDWETPTGGYLLAACLALGYAAGTGAAARIQNQSSPIG